MEVGMEALENLALVERSHQQDSILRITMMIAKTLALGEGKVRRLSALGMGELRVREISPSLGVEKKTKVEKLRGMEKDSPFLLEVDLRGRKREVEEDSLCSKSQV